MTFSILFRNSPKSTVTLLSQYANKGHYMTIAQTIKKPKHSHHHSKDHDLVRSIRLVNFETGEVATIMPNLGATVMELILKSGKKLHSIIEAPASLSEIIENKHYHGVKLIPFPGRIPQGKYTFAGKAYVLKRNASDGASAIHGFVWKKPFRIVRTAVTNRGASVILEYVHIGDTQGYPFKFSVRLTYTLAAGAFSCTTRIRNLDRRAIPVGDGWHPYYKTSGKITHLNLVLPPHTVVELSDLRVPTGRFARQTKTATTIPMSRKRLDAVFDLGERRRVVTSKLTDLRNKIELRIWQEAGKGKYRYLVLYRPESHTSVAVEPWTCTPNAVNNGMGLITLKPGGIFRASYGVGLRSIR
jgi:aldose 1-epimerase